MKDQIAEILRGCQGKRNAITVKNIAERLGVFNENGLTNPGTRFKIKEVIEEFNMPIGSCSRGYYLIETENELSSYIENLNSRIKGIKDRILKVKNAYKSRTIYRVKGSKI